MADEDEAINPRGVYEQDEIFRNFEDLIKDVVVLDEDDEFDDEIQARSEMRSSQRRSNSRERWNNKWSPGRPTNKNGTKSGGAPAFLLDLKKKFGDFPELVQMNRRSAILQTEREIRRLLQTEREIRDGRRGHEDQQRNLNYQQCPHGGMSQGSNPGMCPMSMQYGPQMMGGMATPDYGQMMNPGMVVVQQMMPGVDPMSMGTIGMQPQQTNSKQNQNDQQFPHGGMLQGWNPGMVPMLMHYGPQMMGGVPTPDYSQMMNRYMMMGQQMMPGVDPMSMGMLGMQTQQTVSSVDNPPMNDTSDPELTMPLQISNQRSRENISSSRHSKLPNRSSRQRLRSRDHNSR